MSSIYSAVISIVGTLNDVDIASPGFYKDVNGLHAEVLAETPAIQRRKEWCRYDLRRLKDRFIEKDRDDLLEPLWLCAVPVTYDRRSIDATNVLDWIQNAGNKVIWGDDSQFVSAHCWRSVNPRVGPAGEHTVVYVGRARRLADGKVPFGLGLLQKIAADFRERYDFDKCMEKHFDIDERFRFSRKGFWEDARFLEIPVLRPSYIRWMARGIPAILLVVSHQGSP